MRGNPALDTPRRRESTGHAPTASGARRARSGAVLLEVIVALTILSVAGVAAVTATGESVRAAVRLRETEHELREASAILEAVALWPREDLDRRLGDRAQGRWRLRIDRRSPTVYEIRLADSSGVHVLLETALYRPALPRLETRPEISHDAR